MPNLVVDCQNLVNIEIKEFNNKLKDKILNRVASLDNPYSEALMSRFSKYVGRLGTPDLNVEIVLDRLPKKDIKEKEKS